jgi:DNA-binding transcriptional LysR family regulator
MKYTLTPFARAPKFDLRDVRAILCLAEELHFGNAAARLFTSQSALSRTIRSFEQDLGVSLLERTTRKVKLTAAGLAFVAEAKLAMGHLNHAVQSAMDAAEGRAGRLRIGYMDFAINGRLPMLLNQFRALFPRDTLDLQYYPTARQRSALLEGQLDVGLVLGEFNSPKISCVLLEQYDYVALLPDGHPLVHKENLKLTDLADKPFVLGTEDAFSTFRQMLLPICHAAGFLPNVVQTASSTNGIFGMVAAGVGVSVYAGSARNIVRTGVVVKPLVDVTEPIPTFAAWVSDNQSEVLQRFKDFLIANARLGLSR